MSGPVDFVNVSTEGLESSPVAAGQKSKLAGTIRGSYFVIKGEH